MDRPERMPGAAAIPDLHERMQAAAQELHGGDDLSTVLVRLHRVIGPGTGIERVVLCDGAPDAPGILAAHPGSGAGREAHDHLGAVTHEVHDHRRPVRREADPERGGGPARVGVPVLGGGRTLAVLIGELGPGDDRAALVALEAMATLLVPLLLVHDELDTTRDLDRLRSDFISRISHELRTPLTIITGFAGTLGAHEDTLTTEQRHAMLDRIVTASIRLEHLVEEVLSLASVEAGLAEPQPKLVPVRDVVDLAVLDRGGTDRVDVHDPAACRIVTDPEVARVVIGPMVENALQHAERATVHIVQTGDAVRITVEDDGPGVPPQLADRVFDRFVRGDDRSPGMGLGLAIARRMAETIGARVWHEQVDNGARFVAELRAMPPA